MKSQPHQSSRSEDLKPTGERYLPWTEDSVMACEHLHRYAYASRFVTGKRVLDLACGEGYGSSLLARAADLIVGIDIEEQAVHHAREKYSGSNLHFLTGSITAIPLSARFDVIVCFEVLEHIDDQDQLLSEVKRLLEPGGLLVISTPNKSEYRKQEPSNPFHVRELDFDEFRALLARFFSQMRFLGQRMQCGSGLSSSDRSLSGAVSPLVIDRSDGEFVLSGSDPRPPRYFVGIASDVQIPSGFAGEFMADASDSYIREMARIRREIARIQRELEETIRAQEEALSWREEQTRQFEGTIRSHEQALAWRASQIDDLQGTIRGQQLVICDQQLRIREQQRDFEALAARMQAYESSRTWLMAQKFYRFRDRVFPPQSFRRRIYDRLIGKIRL